MRALILVAMIGGSALGACTNAATQGASDRGGSNVLTQEQLAATNSANVYDAIAKLRPEWLTTRGPTSVSDATPTTASVFMNGTLLGKGERTGNAPLEAVLLHAAGMGCLPALPDFRALNDLADLYEQLGEPVPAKYPQWIFTGSLCSLACVMQ